MTTNPWPERRQEALATLAVGALVAAACLLLAALVPTFFWHDDNQLGGIPGIHEIARGVRSGEWPILSHSNWNCAAIMGEYCGGIFSPVVITVNLLATALGATMAANATISATLLSALAAMGAFRVARQEGLPTDLATMVGVVASLNGWHIAWSASNWVPALAGFATLTWAWWSLAATVKPQASVLGVLGGALGVFLVMTAGWPHSIFMLALVTAWLVVRATWQQRTGWPLLTAFAAWILGIGLASPAWMPFIEYLATTNRPSVGSTLQWDWLVPPSSLPGLVLPSWVSRWDAFNPNQPHVAIELANGLVTTAALLGALLTLQRLRSAALGWVLALAGIGLALSMIPSFGMFRWSFRWLPLFHIAGPLAAATWLAALRAPLPPPPDWARDPSVSRWVYNPGAWALVAAVLATAALVISRQPIVSVVLPAVSIGMAAAWMVAADRRRAPQAWLGWAPAGITLAVLLTTYQQVPNGLAVPAWRLPDAVLGQAPFRPDVRYFALVSAVDYFRIGPAAETWGGLIRPGNTMMAGGVRFVNGYSALQHRGLLYAFSFGVHGFVDQPALAHHARMLPPPGALLARLGVDGMVVGRSQAAAVPQIVAQGWQVTRDEPEGILLHRLGAPSPQVRSVAGVRHVSDRDVGTWRAALDHRDSFPVVAAGDGRPAGTLRLLAPRAVRTIADGRNAISLDVATGPEPAIIGVSRVWLPGYEAFTAAGAALPLLALDGITIGIEVPAGVGGPITLRYRPPGLTYGLSVAGGTLLLMFGLAALGIRRRVRPQAA